MAKRYAIWNKTDMILTPIGEVLTPEQWISRYPIAGVESIAVVCGAGEINGAFFGTLGQMVQMYTAQGADFSEATTPEEKLEVIEAFEDAMNAPRTEPTAEERQAQALEQIASGATSETTAMMNALLGEDEIDEAEVTA
jgi:hypothetical protein